MAIDLKRYERLKTDVDRLQRDADRAEGALAQLMGRLEKEHDCATLQDAETLLKKLQAKEKAAEEKFATALAEFEEEWSDVLSEK